MINKPLSNIIRITKFVILMNLLRGLFIIVGELVVKLVPKELELGLPRRLKEELLCMAYVHRNYLKVGKTHYQAM